jgi:hypothetical protein
MSANDKDTLRLLEMHAITLANVKDSIGIDIEMLRTQNTSLSRFEKAFVLFVETLEESSYPQDYLQDREHPATIAYWRFWKEHDSYKRSETASP